MGFSINQAMGTAAQGVADVAGNYAKTEIGKRATMDLESYRAKILRDRDERLHEQAVDLETRVRQPFQRGEREAGQAFTAGQNYQNRQHQTGMQATQLEHAARENALNRQVQRDGQGIQSRQLAIMERSADLDLQIKQIQVNNAREVERLREQFQSAQDPAERNRLSDTIGMLTGKTNEHYLPVPLKDAQGNVTGYEIFDKRRGLFVDNPKNNVQIGAKWNDETGIVYLQGEPIGKAKNPVEAQELVKKHRQRQQQTSGQREPQSPIKPDGLINGAMQGYGNVLDQLAPRQPVAPVPLGQDDFMPTP